MKKCFVDTISNVSESSIYNNVFLPDDGYAYASIFSFLTLNDLFVVDGNLAKHGSIISNICRAKNISMGVIFDPFGLEDPTNLYRVEILEEYFKNQKCTPRHNQTNIKKGEPLK